MIQFAVLNSTEPPPQINPIAVEILFWLAKKDWNEKREYPFNEGISFFLKTRNSSIFISKTHAMPITIQNTINAPLKKVWECWTMPEHIVNWNFASDEWCCPKATNDLRPGGELNWRMEAKDGSMGFDFTGTYEEIETEKRISCKLGDGRAVQINFEQNGDSVILTESFEAEGAHTDEQQRVGWQAILENFKNYVER